MRCGIRADYNTVMSDSDDPNNRDPAHSDPGQSDPAEGDPGELARQFLDLWQDQLTAMAGDQELAELTRRWATVWPKMNLSALAESTGAKDLGGAFDAGRGSRDGSKESGSQRPAPATAASDDRDVDLAQLTERIEALEERIAALESDAAPPGRGSGKRADTRPDTRPGTRPSRKISGTPKQP